MQIGLSGGLGGPLITGYNAADQIQVDFTSVDETMSAIADVFGDMDGAEAVLNSYFGMTIRGLQTSR